MVPDWYSPQPGRRGIPSQGPQDTRGPREGVSGPASLPRQLPASCGQPVRLSGSLSAGIASHLLPGPPRSPRSRETPLPAGRGAAGGARAGEPPSARVYAWTSAHPLRPHLLVHERGWRQPPPRVLQARAPQGPSGESVNCLPHTKREVRFPERSPATARQLECELFSVPLSRVALGKASKAPGDRGAGLEGHTGTRHSVREWSLRGRCHGPGAPANRSAARGGSGGIRIPGRTLREMPTAGPRRRDFLHPQKQ